MPMMRSRSMSRRGPRAGRSPMTDGLIPADGMTPAEGEAVVAGVPVSTIEALSSGRTGAPIGRANSLIIQGSPLAGVAAPGGGVDSPLMAWQVAEAAWLHRLGLPAGNIADELVTQLRHVNDNLITGFVPFSVFHDESFWNPIAGRWANGNDPLQIVVRKTSAGAVTYFPVWTTATSRAQGRSPRGMLRPSIAGAGGRSLLAIGAQQEYTVAAGAQVVMTFQIQEEGVIDRLVLEAGVGAVAQVVGITYDNDSLLPLQSCAPVEQFSAYSWNNPQIKHYVRVGHFLTVTIRSLAGAGGPFQVAGAFTVR